MALFQFNHAMGRTVEYYNRIKSNDPAASGWMIILLKAAEADDALRDHETLSQVLAATNVEADFTNYIRKVLTDADIVALPAPDNVANTRTLSIPNQTYSNAGGAVDNTMTNALVCYAPDLAGPTTAIYPCWNYPYTAETNGGDLPLNFNPQGAFREFPV